MVSFLAKVKILISGRKSWTIIVRRFGQISFCAHNSSLAGAMKAENCTILLLLRCPFIYMIHVSFLAKVQIFDFWLKTMDYSQAFWSDFFLHS